MKARRILQIAHNHPGFHPGGTEIVALALHRQALAEGLDSWFLGALDSDQVTAHPGTQIIALSDDHRESALHVESFDNFMLRQEDCFGLLREFSHYLTLIRPDVIHVHHLLNFGLEMLFAIRRTLPNVRIVLTLHDYYLICAHYGQLFLHDTGQRCDGPTLPGCLKCFPEKSAADFVMRRGDIGRALAFVDRLVSPSHFLKQRFETYLPACPPIAFVENGYVGNEAGGSAATARNGQTVFGYFGNISAIKGLGDLLLAFDLLEARGVTACSLKVHGSQLFEDDALSAAIASSQGKLGHRLVLHGMFRPAELPGLMAEVDHVVFPSRWWENAPLVVYEALHHGRNVIAYPHGGAAEILRRHGAGLLAARSDPSALADVIESVIVDPSQAIQPAVAVPGIGRLLAACVEIYEG